MSICLKRVVAPKTSAMRVSKDGASITPFWPGAAPPTVGNLVWRRNDPTSACINARELGIATKAMKSPCDGKKKLKPGGYFWLPFASEK